MVFFISMIAALIFVLVCGDVLKKHPWPFYAAATVISFVLAFVQLPQIPEWTDRYIINLFRSGTLGTAFFVIVMYAGALKNGSKGIRKLMPIRGQLSILASVLALCHCVFWGKTLCVKLLTDPGQLPGYQIISLIITIVMLIIMVPLFITSFPFFRHKMNAQKWKKLQRLAYVFYALMYFHVAVLMIHGALNGKIKYAASFSFYTLLFCAYAIMRLRKSKAGEGKKLAGQVMTAFLAGSMVTVSWFGALSVKVQDTAEQMETAHTDVSTWKDGVYEGIGAGYGGKVKVQVVIEDGKISVIKVLDNKEDKPYLDKAMSVIDEIIGKQTYEVDTVSGATSSSDAIITGVRRAIKQAAGE